MIARPLDVWDGLDILDQLSTEAFFIHLFKKTAFSRSDFRIAMRLHGNMEDHLFSFLVSFLGNGFCIGSERQNGESERKIQFKEFLNDETLAPKIVDDQRDLRSKDCFLHFRLKHDKNQLMRPSISNPYVHTKGFR